MVKTTKEKKTKITISIYKSIHEEIMVRLKKRSMKLSPLIEQLLVSWAYRMDKQIERNRDIIKKYEEQLKNIDPKEEDLKKFLIDIIPLLKEQLKEEEKD